MREELLQEAFRKYGTPLYVFDLDILKEQTERIRAGFGPEISLCYAMKANPFLTGYMAQWADRIEVCSMGEFQICRRLQVPSEKLFISGVNLMQASALNIRKAYKRSASALPRIASFIGTSNREDLLVDRTGSRRFLCVSLEHAIDCVTPVEHEQLYAQLKAELLSGERSWFNKEEEQAIQQHNALFYKHIPEEEVFRLCFRFATKEDKDRKSVV